MKKQTKINKQKTKIFLSIMIASTLFSITTGVAFADTAQNCQPIYGGGTTCTQNKDLTLDKKILNPQTGSLVDSLNADNYKFTPEQLVSFQITIKNNSGNSLSNITFKDIFPNKYLNFYSGPGKFDNNTKTMNLIINMLNKDETKIYTVRGTIANASELPNNQTICLSNQAQVIEGNQISQDNTPFCLTSSKIATETNNTESSTPATTKGGLPIYRATNSKHTPSTGPEDIAVFGLIPTGALGWFLRKKTKI